MLHTYLFECCIRIWLVLHMYLLFITINFISSHFVVVIIISSLSMFGCVAAPVIDTTAAAAATIVVILSCN